METNIGHKVLESCRKGDKVWFSEERKPYTIKAKNDRFLICTKPFNLKKTVLYTVVDLNTYIRGTENLVFGFGVETDQQCEDMLDRLSTDFSEISKRNQVYLRVSKVKKGN